MVMGGPFHAILSRLGMLGKNGLPTLGAAVFLALVAWLPSALLSIADYFYNGNATALSYFSDYTAYIRYLLAVSVMVITVHSIRLRLLPLIDQFLDARLIHEESIDRFHAAVKTTSDRTNSAVAEYTMLVIVILIAAFPTILKLDTGETGWSSQVVDGETILSIAGWWSHWVSNSLFRFLLLRWIWRFAIWGWLLFQISQMRLRLVPFHPDRCGGLGFLSVYPMVFLGEIFALSSVFAARLVSQFYQESISVELLQLMVLGWMGLVLIVFIGPLTVFASQLYRLWEEYVFSLGRLGSEHSTAFQQKWIHNQVSGADLLGSQDVSSAADLMPVAGSPYTMRLLPITMPIVFSVVIAAGIPMLAVVATQMPLLEFLRRVSQTFL